MNYRQATTLLSLALFWVIGCATTSDQKALRKVKKVAIIGFAAAAKNQDQSLKYILRPNITADMLYRVVGSRLQQSQKWLVMTPNSLRRNEAYKKLYKKYASHLLNAGVRCSGILAPIESFNMSIRARNRLIKALGVDALAEVGFIVEKAEIPVAVGSDQATVTAKVSFDLYVRSQEDSIWHVANLPTRTQQALTPVPETRFRTPEERALAISINSAMSAMFELKDGPPKTTEAAKPEAVPASVPPAPAAAPTALPPGQQPAPPARPGQPTPRTGQTPPALPGQPPQPQAVPGLPGQPVPPQPGQAQPAPAPAGLAQPQAGQTPQPNPWLPVQTPALPQSTQPVQGQGQVAPSPSAATPQGQKPASGQPVPPAQRPAAPARPSKLPPKT